MSRKWLCDHFFASSDFQAFLSEIRMAARALRW
jgi:hypothetical protein